MANVIFVVEDSPEGGFDAKALGQSIFTQADTFEELRENIREAVACHFDVNKMPKLIRISLCKR